MNGEVYKVLKAIRVMNCEDTSDILENRPASSDSDDKDFLLEALAPEAKSFDNMDTRFDAMLETRRKVYGLGEDSGKEPPAQPTSSKHWNGLGNGLANEEQEGNLDSACLDESKDSRQRFLDAPEESKEKAALERDHPGTIGNLQGANEAFMKVHWHELVGMLHQQKKRELKRRGNKISLARVWLETVPAGIEEVLRLFSNAICDSTAGSREIARKINLSLFTWFWFNEKSCL